MRARRELALAALAHNGVHVGRFGAPAADVRHMSRARCTRGVRAEMRCIFMCRTNGRGRTTTAAVGGEWGCGGGLFV